MSSHSPSLAKKNTSSASPVPRGGDVGIRLDHFMKAGSTMSPNCYGFRFSFRTGDPLLIPMTRTAPPISIASPISIRLVVSVADGTMGAREVHGHRAIGSETVLPMCGRTDMKGVTASRVITGEMVKFCPGWHRAKGRCVGVNVHKPSAFAPPGKPAVAVGVAISRPEPTHSEVRTVFGNRSILVGLGRESFLGRGVSRPNSKGISCSMPSRVMHVAPTPASYRTAASIDKTHDYTVSLHDSPMSIRMPDDCSRDCECSHMTKIERH